MPIKLNLLRNSTLDISLLSSMNLTPLICFEIRLVSNRKFLREPAKVMRLGRHAICFLRFGPKTAVESDACVKECMEKRD